MDEAGEVVEYSRQVTTPTLKSLHAESGLQLFSIPTLKPLPRGLEGGKPPCLLWEQSPVPQAQGLLGFFPQQDISFA
jgi:hypothetical protein